jgi:F420-dependent oxidoreductase-like protein
VRIGVFTMQTATVEAMVADARAVREAGFASFWSPQIFNVDALTALAVVAREVPDLELGTFVVPTFPRHPTMLAAQARTVQQLAGGRLTLGIGLSHQIVIEMLLGMSFDKPVRHMREYLEILTPLLRGEPAAYEGEVLSTQLALDIPESTPVPVLVAALGTQMLNVAGRLADGTATWMTGPRTLADHIVPTIRAAAERAGRPAPRIAAGLPVGVCDDAEAARATAGNLFSIYDGLPSYRAMLDREGATGPADVAIVGDEAAVRAQIEQLAEAGVTDLVAVPFTEPDRTLDLLRSLL